MKTGFSILELLIIIVILCVISLFMLRGYNPVKRIIYSNKEMNTKQEIINKQLDEIQNAKDLRDKRLKKNLEQNY